MSKGTGRKAEQTKRTSRGPTNTWDQHQRTVLHVLNDNFVLSHESRAHVFSTYFKDHLASRGLYDGLKSGVLNVQYAERRTKPQIWRHVVAEPSTDADRRARRELINDLRKVIDGLQNPTSASSPDKVLVASGPSAPATGPATGNASQKRTVSGPSAWSYHVVHAFNEPNLAQMVAGSNLNTSFQPEGTERPELSRRSKRRRSSASSGDAPIAYKVLTAVSLPSPAKRAFTGRVNVAGPIPGTSVRTEASTLLAASVDDPPLPSTPTRTPARKRPVAPRSPYCNRKGAVIRVSEKGLRGINSPYLLVPEALAHPPLVGGLFYRFWDAQSFGTNSPNGFEAARFQWTNSRPPPPTSRELRIEDVENHVADYPIASPFVSVSNNLLWVLRKALKETSKRKGDSKMTLIDADVITASQHITRVFHLPPYFAELRKHKVFNDGKWRYGGIHEYMVWREIPREAIIATFKLQDLLDAANQHPVLQRILREHIVRSPGDLKTAIVGQLKSDKIELTAEIVASVARWCRVVGISSPRQIEHFVMDIVQGWQLHVVPRTAEQWAHYAEVFLHRLCGVSTLPNFQTAQKLKLAFLHGIRSSAGKFNALHLGAKSQKAIDRAADTAGLSDPAGIVLNSMAAAVRGIQNYEHHHRSRRERDVQAGAELVEIQAAFKLQSDVVVNPSPSPGTTDVSCEDEQDVIMYDEDDIVLGL